MQQEPVLSVIVPIFNEEDIVRLLCARTLAVFEKLQIPCEMICVDDGSKDKTLALLMEARQKNPAIKVISFSRNFGHQTAITAGLNYSKGQAVMIIDGDLQDPPEIIPEFLKKWQEGYEVVYGVRQKRKESAIKKFFYAAYYRILEKLANVYIPLDSGDCGLMDRKIVDLLNAMPETNRFVRGLRSWVGFRQVGLLRNAPFQKNKSIIFSDGEINIFSLIPTLI